MRIKFPLGFLALAVPGCIVTQVTETEDLVFVETVAEVEAETAAGRIDVRVDPTVDEIEVFQTLRYSGERPRVEAYVEGDVLVLISRCENRGFLGPCAVDFDVLLPTPAALSADTGSGAVLADGMQGDLVASTGSGRISLSNVAGTVDASTGSGRIEVVNADLTEVKADTGSGGVSLDIVSVPEYVDVDTGSGGVDVWVPEGAYRLSIDTGSGGISTDGIIDDAEASSEIRVKTGSGGVRIHGI